MQWLSFGEQVLPLIMISFVFYILVIRPGRKLDWARYQAVKSLKGGETVLTHGYLLGTVKNIDGEVYEVEVAPGISIKVEQQGIREVRDTNVVSTLSQEDQKNSLQTLETQS